MEGTFYLVRVYGGVDPVVLPDKLGASMDCLKEAIKKNINKEGHDEDDMFFYLRVQTGQVPTMDSFSGGFMEGILEELGA